MPWQWLHGSSARGSHCYQHLWALLKSVCLCTHMYFLSTYGRGTSLKLHQPWMRMVLHTLVHIHQPYIWKAGSLCSFNLHVLYCVRMTIISDVWNSFVFPALWTDNFIYSLLYISLLGLSFGLSHVCTSSLFTTVRKLTLCLPYTLQIFFFPVFSFIFWLYFLVLYI